MIALVCYKPLRTKVPLNYCLLAWLTILETCTVAGFISIFTTQSVLMCIGIMAGSTSALAVVSLFLPKDDATIGKFMVIGSVCSMVMMTLFFILLFMGGLIPTWVMTMYAVLGCIASCIYILVDLLLIQVMDFDDYILGALMLYLDMINMLIYLLQLFGDN